MSKNNENAENNASRDQQNEETRQMHTTDGTAGTTNTATPEPRRRKRKGLFIAAGAVAALLLAGGVGFAVSEIADDDDDNQVRTVSAAENRSGNQDARDGDDAGADDTAGSDAASFRDAAEQAVAEAGGRGASSIDLQRDGHEVDVELDDGASAEVHVAADGAMRIETEGADRFDREDPVLDLATLEDAMDAALTASDEAGVRDGVVDSVSASDDRGVAYEVSVQGADGREVDVDLADDFSVVTTDLDD